MRYKVGSALLVLASAVLLPQSVLKASIISQTTYHDTDTAFAVSNSDLVDSHSSTFFDYDTDYQPDFGAGEVTNVNDGVDGGTSFVLGTWLFNPRRSPWHLTFLLDPSATQGFEINSLTVTTGFQVPILNQHYIVSVATVSDPTFHQLYSVDLTSEIAAYKAEHAGDSPAVEHQWAQVNTSENVTGVLATGVTAVRFDFPGDYDGSDTANGVLREIDIFGSAVPEPTCGAALSLGALLLRRKRR